MDWCKEKQPRAECQQDQGVDSGSQQETAEELPPSQHKWVQVKRMDNLKYLSIYITQDLSWFCHINKPDEESLSMPLLSQMTEGLHTLTQGAKKLLHLNNREHPVWE